MGHLALLGLILPRKCFQLFHVSSFIALENKEIPPLRISKKSETLTKVRQIYLVSTSEIRAGKEQFDYEVDKSPAWSLFKFE